MNIEEKRREGEKIKKQINELHAELIKLENEPVDFELTKAFDGNFAIKTKGLEVSFKNCDANEWEFTKKLNELMEGDKILIKFNR